MKKIALVASVLAITACGEAKKEEAPKAPEAAALSLIHI